jgi:CRP/FNR family transcriptional regulator, cyclic AMP receptor protein
MQSAAAAAGAAAALAGARLPQRGPAPNMGREWVNVLAEVPLFAGLSKRHLRRIADQAVATRFPERAVIIRTGSRGETFHVILDGTAEVRLERGAPLRLDQGDFFGEMALIDGKPRSASVEAMTDLLTMKLSRRAFLKVLEDEPAIALEIMKELAGRVRGLDRSEVH